MPADKWRVATSSVCLLVSSTPSPLSSRFIDLAVVAAGALWVRQVESEHIAHQHHIIEENGGKLPEPPAYEYLNRRGACPPVNSH